MKLKDVKVDCIACMSFGSPAFGTIITGGTVSSSYGVVQPFIAAGYLRLTPESSIAIKSVVDSTREKQKAVK